MEKKKENQTLKKSKQCFTCVMDLNKFLKGSKFCNINILCSKIKNKHTSAKDPEWWPRPEINAKNITC